MVLQWMALYSSDAQVNGLHCDAFQACNLHSRLLHACWLSCDQEDGYSEGKVQRYGPESPIACMVGPAPTMPNSPTLQ